MGNIWIDISNSTVKTVFSISHSYYISFYVINYNQNVKWIKAHHA